MARSLSNLVNNLSEGIHKIKCKYRYHDHVKHAELNTKIVTVFLNTYTLKVTSATKLFFAVK